MAERVTCCSRGRCACRGGSGDRSAAIRNPFVNSFGHHIADLLFLLQERSDVLGQRLGVAAKGCNNDVERLKTLPLVFTHVLHHLCFTRHNGKLLEKILLFAFRGLRVIGRVKRFNRDFQSSLKLSMDQVDHLKHDIL